MQAGERHRQSTREERAMIFGRRTLLAAAGWVVAGVLAVAVAGGVASAGAQSGLGLASSTAQVAPTDGTGGSGGAGPTASADVEDRDARKQRARPWLWRHLEHGELVVRRQEGHEDTLIQRGRVTAVEGDTLTVRSLDGFTATWTVSEETRVRQEGKAAEFEAVKARAQVVVAGPGSDTTGQARFIRIRG
jgi:hypothetical protein